jgi:hypothetical protein
MDASLGRRRGGETAGSLLEDLMVEGKGRQEHFAVGRWTVQPWYWFVSGEGTLGVGPEGAIARIRLNLQKPFQCTLEVACDVSLT